MNATNASVKVRKFPVWVWFYFAFMALFTAWYFLFRAAYENQPQTVPLEHHVKESRSNSAQP